MQKNLIIDIAKKRGLTGEQLIRVTCGSAAVFFIFLYIIITIYKKKTHRYIDIDVSYSLSSEINTDKAECKEFIQEQREENCDNEKSSNDESDFSFWI